MDGIDDAAWEAHLQQLDAVGAAGFVEHPAAPEDGAAAVPGVRVEVVERVIAEPCVAVILRSLRGRRPLVPGHAAGSSEQLVSSPPPARGRRRGG